jgi:hypothetical protein
MKNEPLAFLRETLSTIEGAKGLFSGFKTQDPGVEDAQKKIDSFFGSIGESISGAVGPAWDNFVLWLSKVLPPADKLMTYEVMLTLLGVIVVLAGIIGWMHIRFTTLQKNYDASVEALKEVREEVGDHTKFINRH